MATIRELTVRLGVKTDPRGFRNATAGLQKMIMFAKAAAAAFVGLRAVQAIRGVAEDARILGDRLDKTSQQLGLTTDALQELEFAGGLAGVSTGEMTVALRQLARTAVEAADGAAEYADDYAKMGVRVHNANGTLKSADQLLEEVADGMGRLSTDTERTAIAQKLLGRSGSKLIPLLTAGSGKLREQREEARELGLMNQRQIQMAVELTDNQWRLSRAFTSVKLALAERMMPAINAVVLRMVEFFKINREIIAQKLFGFLERVGKVFAAMGRFIVDVVSATRRWYQGLGPVAKQIMKITGFILAMVVALALPAVPMMLLITMIGLLIEDFQTWREGGDSVIGDLVEGFKRLTKVVATHRDMFIEWVGEHQTGITLVTSMILGLAWAIKGKLIVAQTLSIGQALKFKLAWIASYAKVQAASIAAALKSAAVWLATTIPLALTIALVGVLIGTLVFLGAELVKLATGQENFFSTMSQGISDLIDEWGGIGPAIGAMLDTALRYWLEFFGATKAQAQKWINDFTASLDKFFPQWLKDLLAFESEQEAQGKRSRISQVAQAARVPGAESMVDNRQTRIEVQVNTQPGADAGEIGKQVSHDVERVVRKSWDREYRSAMRDFAVEGAT